MTSSNSSSQISPLGWNDAVASEYSAWSASSCWGGLSEQSRCATLDELLDFVGDTLADRAGVGMPPWLNVLLEDSGKHSASVAGGHRAAPWTAAMANAYFGNSVQAFARRQAAHPAGGC